jgi:hypothetical protein
MKEEHIEGQHIEGQHIEGQSVKLKAADRRDGWL